MCPRLVKQLNDLYTMFDAGIDNFNVYKVSKKLNDLYMFMQ